MIIKEALIIKSLLETAYPNSYPKIEDGMFYMLIKDYNYERTLDAVKEIISTSKYPPSFAEIKENYDKLKYKNLEKIINEMYNVGYYRFGRDYEKTIKMIREGIVPNFIQEDIDEYLKNKNKVLEYKKGD